MLCDYLYLHFLNDIDPAWSISSTSKCEYLLKRSPLRPVDIVKAGQVRWQKLHAMFVILGTHHFIVQLKKKWHGCAGVFHEVYL